MSHADDLSTVLTDLGVEIKRISGDELNGRCPVHYKFKGRNSNRHSWYMNVDTGLWHCFTCHARGNLPQLVSELTDDPGALWNIQSTLISNGLHRLSAEDAVYDKHVDESVDWTVYAKFPTVPESVLRARRLDADVAFRFGVRWDPDERATLVPIVSPLGELRGWQAKKTGWVMNYPKGGHKSVTLFGIERAFEDTALLLESPLDVVRFHSVIDKGVSAIASFGASVSKEQIEIMYRRFDRLIIAMDNDKAGNLETKRLLGKLGKDVSQLPSFRKGVRFWDYSGMDVKDLGDMTDGQIVRGLSNVTSVFR
jgi:hypothetical protein